MNIKALPDHSNSRFWKLPGNELRVVLNQGPGPNEFEILAQKRDGNVWEPYGQFEYWASTIGDAEYRAGYIYEQLLHQLHRQALSAFQDAKEILDGIEDAMRVQGIEA
jgi:hypothetical protein